MHHDERIKHIYIKKSMLFIIPLNTQHHKLKHVLFITHVLSGTHSQSSLDVAEGSCITWSYNLKQVGRLHCLFPWWEDATVDFMTSGGYNVVSQIKKVFSPIIRFLVSSSSYIICYNITKNKS